MPEEKLEEMQLMNNLNSIEPTASPENIIAIIGPSSSSTVMIRWNPPPLKDQNGIIIGYTIKLVRQLRNQQDSGQTIRIRIDKETSTTISNLTPSTNYTIIIAASTSAGTGPYSIPIFYKTHDLGIMAYKIYYN